MAPALQLLHQLQRVQQLHLQLLHRSYLLDAVACWKDVLRGTRQRRCEALFNTLRVQAEAAACRADAADQAQRWLSNSLIRASHRAWSSVTFLSRQRRRLAQVADVTYLEGK